MEFNKDLIESTLKVWGFNLENLNIENIQHVPMHEWRVSTSEKPQLYIENLQCCVGLYAYGNGFGFAAHINTVVFDKNEFKLNEKNEPVFCNRCIDLLEQIMKYRGKIVEEFKIGISLGVTPLNDNEKSMILIYNGINEVIKILKSFGIPVVGLTNIYKPELIIDAQNNCLIVPDEKKKIK